MESVREPNERWCITHQTQYIHMNTERRRGVVEKRHFDTDVVKCTQCWTLFVRLGVVYAAGRGSLCPWLCALWINYITAHNNDNHRKHANHRKILVTGRLFLVAVEMPTRYLTNKSCSKTHATPNLLRHAISIYIKIIWQSSYRLHKNYASGCWYRIFMLQRLFPKAEGPPP